MSINVSHINKKVSTHQEDINYANPIFQNDIKET